MGLFFKTPEEKAAKKALKEERSRLYVAKTQAKIARTKLRAQKATVRRDVAVAATQRAAARGASRAGRIAGRARITEAKTRRTVTKTPARRGARGGPVRHGRGPARAGPSPGPGETSPRAWVAQGAPPPEKPAAGVEMETNPFVIVQGTTPDSGGRPAEPGLVGTTACTSDAPTAARPKGANRPPHGLGLD